jgi:hypothetical protein
LQPDGVHAGYEQAPGDEAVMLADIAVAEDWTFEATGSIAFGVRHTVRFRTVSAGHLDRTPDRHLRQGSVIATIEGGSGQFEGAEGRITSNFLLSDTGELTDHQIGLVFIREAREDPADH